jgi:hypothetical protein
MSMANCPICGVPPCCFRDGGSLVPSFCSAIRRPFPLYTSLNKHGTPYLLDYTEKCCTRATLSPTPNQLSSLRCATVAYARCGVSCCKQSDSVSFRVLQCDSFNCKYVVPLLLQGSKKSSLRIQFLKFRENKKTKIFWIDLQKTIF